jgi:hypothetical protein
MVEGDEQQLDIDKISGGDPVFFQQQQELMEQLSDGRQVSRPPQPQGTSSLYYSEKSQSPAPEGMEDCTACCEPITGKKEMCGHWYCAACLAQTENCCGAPV